MELNHDCVRDVLLVVEKSGLNTIVKLDDLTSSDQLAGYAKEQILYSVSKLRDKDYLKVELFYVEAGSELVDFAIFEITWDGHQFLDNVRDNKVWAAVKQSALKNFSSVSIGILTELAKSYLTKKLF